MWISNYLTLGQSPFKQFKVVLLQHARHHQHSSTPRPHHGFLQDYSHVVYILKEHQGLEDRTQAYDAGICYLDYDALLHAAPETDHFEGSFAPHATLTINGAYVLYEGPSTGPVQNSYFVVLRLR